MKSKLLNGPDAVNLIKDGDTITITSAGLIGYPKYLLKCLEQRYLEEKSPRGLTLVSGCGHGVWDHRGDSRFAHPGFLKRVICTHPDAVPPLRKMIENDEIEGYIFPQGVLNQLFRSIAAKQPGIISKIGLGTYMDPRLEGGRVNRAAREELIELIHLDNEEWLFYRSFPINVAMIRATTADEKGNLTIEREGMELQLLAVASAARSSGGKVIAQVERIAASGSLNPKDVVVPGIMVDAIVIAENPTENHMQTTGTYYSPYYSGELKSPRGMANSNEVKSVLTLEDIIARRATFELFPGAVVNLGIGIPAAVGAAAALEGIRDDLTFTIELGVIGGIPAGIPDFGVALDPEAFISHPSMFDFYHGGGLDMTFLGAAQVDQHGNVNVSKFGPRISGTGGFIDISQSTGKVVFCTYFKAKGLEGEISGGKLRITREGDIVKFVENVQQISFNGRLARDENKEVVIITERAVFKLTGEGMVLEEVAPGIDLDKDILGQMEFKPVISSTLRTMDERIFRPGQVGHFKKEI